MAWVRALTAVARATRSERIISTIPSPVLGMTVTSPACTARAAASASEGSDLPCRRRADRSGRLTSSTTWPSACEEAGQPGPVAAGAFHPERFDLARAHAPRPAGRRSRRGGRHAHRRQAAAELIFGVRDVDLAVGVDTDRDAGRSGCATVVMAISLLVAGGWHAPAERADSTAMGLGAQAPIRSRPLGWRLPAVAAARVDRSEAGHEAGVNPGQTRRRDHHRDHRSEDFASHYWAQARPAITSRCRR